MSAKPSKGLESKQIKPGGSYLGIWFRGWPNKLQTGDYKKLKNRIKKGYKDPKTKLVS